MKKFLALLLCLVMVVSMVACGAVKNDDESTSGNANNENANNENANNEDVNSEDPSSEEPTNEEPSSEEPSSEEPSSEENTGDEVVATNGDEMSLVEILEGIYAGYSEELPMLATTEITDAETFEWITFAKYVEGYEAAVSEPMMGSIAHSVVLVRVPDGTDVEAVRAEIEENHDPRKWICVEAEKTAVIAHNNTIMLVMCSEALADIVIANFDALWA